MQLLFGYNSWANSRILQAATKVSQGQFAAPAAFPHGGLQGTLTHTFFAEWIWRKRWQGESPATWMTPEEFPTLKSIQTRWLQEEKELMEFVKSVEDDKLNDVFSFKTTRGETRQNILWQTMLHVINHGTQHRSEAAALLTEMGNSPGDIDLILFLREK
jgi:uncharacterized damage-inducible protein DinB